MAYEMGAIYEDGKQMEKVLAEYVQASAQGTSTTPVGAWLVNASHVPLLI